MLDMDCKQKLYDISRPLSEQTPAYPGDPPLTRAYIADHHQGDDYMLTLCHMNSHIGTHVDFPRHFFADGKTASQYAVTQLCGMSQVLTLPPVINVTSTIFQELPITQGFLLLHTTHPQTVLCADAAQYLVEIGVCLLGIDRDSPDTEDGDFPVHHILLKNEVLILENIHIDACAGWRVSVVLFSGCAGRRRCRLGASGAGMCDKII